MSTKRNISSPLKMAFISLLFILSNYAFATTYYIDAANGNDSNIGTSETQAWKTTSKVGSFDFSPGDVIAFKRGQTFSGTLSYSGSSGTSTNPITLTAYGAGAKPIITGFGTLTGTWTNEGNNKWSMPLSVKVTRLYKNGIEQKMTSPVAFGHTWEEFGGSAGTVWIWDNSKLYYYSTTNPSSSQFEGNKQWRIIDLNGKSYINIENLDIRGGTNSVIHLTDCSNINVRYCTLGKQAGYGIVIKSSDSILIERNTIDNDFKLTFDGISSYTGTDARGSNDGVASFGGFTNSEIRYNDFINWGHAALEVETTGSSPISGIKMHHNFITAPDLHYSRAIALSGDNATNIEFYNNYIYKTSIRSQINGINNYVHHNWVDNVIDTPYKAKEQGQAFAYENYNGNPTGNLFEYNTISNTEGPGIEFIASGSSSKDISGNTVQKNLFINCGTNAYYTSGTGKGIYVQGYVDIRANNFYDNAASSTLTYDTIYHRDTAVTPEEFNSRSGLGGDDIYGNTSASSDQGAGPLDLTTIGVNAGSNTSDGSTGPAPQTGPFIMSVDGLH